MTYIIEGIAKESYQHFIHIIEELRTLWTSKRLIIFGAGIMGLQFSYILEEYGINNYLFCDNDERKWEEQWGKSKIISPEELGQNDFIFIAMENFEACKNQVEKKGYVEKKDFIVLINASEKILINDFQKDRSAHTLVLGDCAATVISMKESNKTSIKELLYQPEKVKVLALNGMYMREYYSIVKMCFDKMQYLKNVIILLGIDIFSSKYHLLPKNQHYRVMSSIYEKSNCRNKEVLESLGEIKRRQNYNSTINFISADRTPKLNVRQMNINMKNQMKFLWLYAMDSTTESMKYLERLISECSKKAIALTCVLLPVNYELGNSFYQNNFKMLYESNVKVLQKNVEGWGGRFLDLSYELRRDYFLQGRAVNEGFLYAGRKCIVERIAQRNW